MPTLEQLLTQLSGWILIIPTWVGWTALFAAVVTLLVIRRGRVRYRRLQQELERVRNEMRAMTTAAVGVGGRVRELERRQRQQPVASTRVASPAKAPPPAVEKTPAKVIMIRPSVEDSGSHQYDYAIQLARHGASVNEIVQQSGISTHEAKLIHMLHTAASATTATATPHSSASR